MPLIDRNTNKNGWLPIFFDDIRWGAVVTSFLLTLLIVSQDRMPNDDGVLYLLSAERFAAGAWDAALQLYNWPFYGILIGGLHLLSGLEVETAAYILNGLLQALLVFAFISIVSELGGDRKTLLAAVILVLIFPNLNEYRSEIVRGHGYWAFSMLGLWFLLKHVRRYEPKYLIGWVVALALAGLFRIEGLVLLVSAPVVLLLDSRDTITQRVTRFALVYGGGVTLVGVALVVVAVTGVGEDSLKFWDKPAQMVVQFYTAVSSDLSQKVAILQRDFLIPYADDYASSIVVTSILMILFTEIVASVGLVVGVFAIYAWFRADPVGDVYQRRAVWFFIIINVLMLLAFVVSRGFLTGRYPIALVLVIMLFAPFGAVALYRRLTGPGLDAKPRRNWVNVAFVVVAFALLIDGVFSFSPGKAYVEQAAVWLSEHMLANEQVFSLDAPLLYRSGKLGWERYLDYQQKWNGGLSFRERKEQTLADLLKKIEWREFDYIAALVSRKEPEQQDEIERVLSRSPVKVFANRRGDRVLIYATKTKSTESGGPGA